MCPPLTRLFLFVAIFCLSLVKKIPHHAFPFQNVPRGRAGRAQCRFCGFGIYGSVPCPGGGGSTLSPSPAPSSVSVSFLGCALARVRLRSRWSLLPPPASVLLLRGWWRCWVRLPPPHTSRLLSPSSPCAPLPPLWFPPRIVRDCNLRLPHGHGRAAAGGSVRLRKAPQGPQATGDNRGRRRRRRRRRLHGGGGVRGRLRYGRPRARPRAGRGRGRKRWCTWGGR